MMDGEGDIAGLSVPFVAGVAACALLSSYGVMTTNMAAWISSAALSAISAMLLHIINSRQKLPLSGLFFVTGVFCYSASWMWPGGCMHFRIPEYACSGLKHLIDGIPYPHAVSSSVIKALLTGDRSGLPHEVTASFRSSGASHILALSGLHLGIIYLVVKKIFSAAGNSSESRRARCGATIAATGFYTIMTGAGPSCVRAWLFICINEIAGISPGRKTSPVRVLMASLTIQLALNPTVIAGIGFQMSYLAMFGIVTLLPQLQKFYPEGRTPKARLDPMRKIWDAASLAISCQLFTAPAAWLTFHTFPRYFLLTNLLALPLSTAIMVVSIMTVALTGMGICPEMLVTADDACVQTLLYVLDVISGM